MFIESVSPKLVLSGGELVSLREGRCTRIVCVEGSLWVTRDSQLRDVILGPGDSYSVPDASGVLIQALGPATVRIVEANSPASASATAPLARLGSALGTAFAPLLPGARDDDGAPDVGALITSVVAQRRGAWLQQAAARQACAG